LSILTLEWYLSPKNKKEQWATSWSSPASTSDALTSRKGLCWQERMSGEARASKANFNPCAPVHAANLTPEVEVVSSMHIAQEYNTANKLFLKACETWR